MNANELRLNNFIFDDNGDTTKVFSLSGYGSPEINDDQVSNRYKPIPLTEEWHNKFGVKQNGFGDFVYLISDIKAIVFSGDYVFMRDFEKNIDLPTFNDNLCTIWSIDERKRKMFVHEWQNLYFALTGEELTLKES